MNEFSAIGQELRDLIEEWEPKLLALDRRIINKRRNSQNRTVKQIVGHMVDSASNNTHRIVHLQYQKSPLEFPNYATFGNNDRWIAIQNYQEEDWHTLVQLWKYTHIHIAHVIQNIDPEKLENQWKSGPNETISLRAMVVDFPRHFKLHCKEIEVLVNHS
ncbi:MAG: hypothetical protein JW828_03495 [Sedimentisphaerales bacterium]|nr:hypothetical protein [Sedimentisphaerales bacterium]